MRVPGRHRAGGGESVTFRRGALKLRGTLEVPPLTDGQRVPLAIVMHGLMDSRHSPLARAMSRSLNAAGLATLRFDFNGHGDSDGDGVDMTVLDEIEDARAAYAFARGLERISSICLVGHSQGAVVASMLAGQLGARIAALVLLAPAASLKDSALAGDFLGTRFDPVRLPPWIAVHGYRIGREYLRTAQVLPIYETAARFTGPVSIIHGGGDDIVPVAASARFHEIYRTSELHLLPGLGHDFDWEFDQPAALATTFLTRHA